LHTTTQTHDVASSNVISLLSIGYGVQKVPVIPVILIHKASSGG